MKIRCLLAVASVYLAPLTAFTQIKGSGIWYRLPVLSCSLDINPLEAPDTTGLRPLHKALLKDLSSSRTLLLEGADPNARMPSSSIHSAFVGCSYMQWLMTSSDFARVGGDKIVADKAVMLIEAGAKPSALDEKDLNVMCRFGEQMFGASSAISRILKILHWSREMKNLLVNKGKASLSVSPSLDFVRRSGLISDFRRGREAYSASDAVLLNAIRASNITSIRSLLLKSASARTYAVSDPVIIQCALQQRSDLPIRLVLASGVDPSVFEPKGARDGSRGGVSLLRSVLLAADARRISPNQLVERIELLLLSGYRLSQNNLPASNLVPGDLQIAAILSGSLRQLGAELADPMAVQPTPSFGRNMLEFGPG